MKAKLTITKNNTKHTLELTALQFYQRIYGGKPRIFVETIITDNDLVSLPSAAKAALLAEAGDRYGFNFTPGVPFHSPLGCVGGVEGQKIELGGSEPIYYGMFFVA